MSFVLAAVIIFWILDDLMYYRKNCKSGHKLVKAVAEIFLKNVDCFCLCVCMCVCNEVWISVSVNKCKYNLNTIIVNNVNIKIVKLTSSIFLEIIVYKAGSELRYWDLWNAMHFKLLSTQLFKFFLKIPIPKEQRL